MIILNWESKNPMVDMGSKGKLKTEEDGNSLITKKVRYFWDGGIIANTPLREAVIEHRRYWDSLENLKFLLYAFS